MIYANRQIIIDREDFTKEEVEEILKKMTQRDMERCRIVIDRNTALKGQEFFEKLCSLLPGIDVMIKVDDVEYDANFTDSQVFTREQMNTLFENNAVIEKYGAKLYISAYNYSDDPLKRENRIPFTKIIQANARMNNWVDKINKARVNGKPLSPFEKYLYAYQVVTQFKYTGDQIFEARDISRILSSKYIVCAGYSSILSELCRRIGIVCKRQFIHVYNTGNPELDAPNVLNHEECIVCLKDQKYGIDGFFITDPTLDSYDSAIEEGTSITHALIGLDEHDKLYNFGEEIVLDSFRDYSNYFFLRDAGAIPNVKLIYESPTYFEDVKTAFFSGVYDKNFNSFMTKKFAKTQFPKRVNSSITINGQSFNKLTFNGKPHTIEEIASDESLLTNLAYRYYACASIEENAESDVLKKFFDRSFAIYMRNNNIELNEQTIPAIIAKLQKTAKEDERIYNDNQVLIALGDLRDFTVVLNSGTFEILRDWKTKHALKSPTLEDYQRAMKVVYMARGDSREEAKKEAQFMINTSVWVADAFGWSHRGTQNPFAEEAKRTNPVFTVQMKEIENLAPLFEAIGTTVEHVKELILNGDQEALNKIMEEVSKIIPDVQEKPTEEKKIDNRTIKFWHIKSREHFQNDISTNFLTSEKDSLE